MPPTRHLASLALLLAAALAPAAAHSQASPTSLLSLTQPPSPASKPSPVSKPWSAPPTIRYAIPLSAITSTLIHAGIALPPDRLHLLVSATATLPDPVLTLASAELRQDASLLLRLRCASSADCLPFFVAASTADRPEALALLAQLRAALAPSARPQSHGITVGEHVLLELTDDQMHIQLPTIAIDAGRPGTEIRVASLDRKRTFHGIVTSESTVKAGLQ